MVLEGRFSVLVGADGGVVKDKSCISMKDCEGVIGGIKGEMVLGTEEGVVGLLVANSLSALSAD
jgi:hypothetical protein